MVGGATWFIFGQLTLQNCSWGGKKKWCHHVSFFFFSTQTKTSIMLTYAFKSLTGLFYECLTEQQQSAWPTTMKKRCRDAVMRGSRRSNKCSKCSRPRSSSCRRLNSVLDEPPSHIRTATRAIFTRACFCVCIFPGGPVSTQWGCQVGLVIWVTRPRLQPLQRCNHGR